MLTGQRRVVQNFPSLRSCPLPITVEALPTDTLVSGQLYLRPPSENRFTQLPYKLSLRADDN